MLRRLEGREILLPASVKYKLGKVSNTPPDDLERVESHSSSRVSGPRRGRYRSSFVPEPRVKNWAKDPKEGNSDLTVSYHTWTYCTHGMLEMLLLQAICTRPTKEMSLNKEEPLGGGHFQPENST